MISQLVRPELKKFISYKASPALGEISREIGIPMEEIIKLDAGENPYVENLQNKKLLFNMKFYPYPDSQCILLRQKLALYTRYPPEWIICGNGSDEMIDLLIRTFVSARDEIIISPPTFPMYQFYGQLAGAKIKSVLRTENMSIDAEEIFNSINKKTKLIFIDSPANPAGTVMSEDAVKKLLSGKNIVVVDEAYFEYSSKTVLPLVKRYSNLVVLRTFSKWAGLAGLRIGYIIANPQIINIISSIKSPYNINSAAQTMACFVLDNKEKFLQKIKKIIFYRNLFIKELSRFPELKVYPSEGAYVVFQPKTKAAKIAVFLKGRGILVKEINQPLMKNCVRINLGMPKEMDKLIFQLRRFYENR